MIIQINRFVTYAILAADQIINCKDKVFFSYASLSIRSKSFGYTVDFKNVNCEFLTLVCSTS